MVAGYLFLGALMGMESALSESWIATLAPDLDDTSATACNVEGAELEWRDPDGSQAGLTSGFATACDPVLDFAGDNLYFSGRQSGSSDLRIWRLNLRTRDLRAVTPEGYPARRPFLLPDGSTVFVSRGDLFRVGPENSQPEQLTFTGGLVQSATALPDGRILFLAADHESGRLFSMLPDGTWSTLWPGFDDLKVRDFAIVDSRQLLTLDASGKLYLSALADPFAKRAPIPSDHSTVVRAVQPMPGNGALLLANNDGGSGVAGLRVLAMGFDPEPRWREVTTFDHRSLMALDVAAPSPPVNPLPSIVKPERETGYLFVIDVVRTDDPELAGLRRADLAEMRIRRLGESGVGELLSSVEPAVDGSVYLEVPADTPLSLELVDRQGTVLARSGTPIWVRPNERRGCLGCHVSPAYAPPNVLPKALLQQPHLVSPHAGVSP